MRIKSSSFCVLAALAFGTAPIVAKGQDSSDSATAKQQQSAYRDSIAQESIRKQTDKIQAKITQLLAELKLNGLDTTDAQILADASGHLETLSHEDMQKVIDALQSASLSTEEAERQKNIVGAYQNQKDVSLKLKTLAQDLAAQEGQRALPSKLEILIERQSANIRLTSSLSGADAGHLSNPQQATHSIASSEQSSITGELVLLSKSLAATPDASSSTTTQDISINITKAVSDSFAATGVVDTSVQATSLTTGGPFDPASTKQTAVRDGLIAALRAALSNVDLLTQLEQVRAQLKVLASDQKDLMDVTKQGGLDKSVLTDRQQKIGDRTWVAQALLKSVSAPSSDQLATAQQAIAQSSDALTKAKNPTDAVPQEQSASDALKKASDMLDEQIAAVQKQQASSPSDQFAALQNLQNQINQAQSNAQTSAADLQKLQQQALPTSPQAANKIAQAQEQMQNQNAKNSALSQASQSIQQQLDALKASAQQYQALAQTKQALDQALQQSQAADQSMQNTPNNLTDAAHNLSQAQSSVAQAQQASQAANTPSQQQQQSPQSGVPPDAQQAMQQASDALKGATNSAVQAQGDGAKSQNKTAQAAIKKAEDGIGQAMAQAQQAGQKALGQKPGQGQGQQQQTAQQGKGGQQETGQKGQNANGMASNSGNGAQQRLAGVGGGGGNAQVIGGLTPKDRDAITQYQAEKSAPEYAPKIQQYLKNIADSTPTATR